MGSGDLEKSQAQAPKIPMESGKCRDRRGTGSDGTGIGEGGTSFRLAVKIGFPPGGKLGLNSKGGISHSQAKRQRSR